MSSTTPLLEDVYYLYIQSQNRNLDILLENIMILNQDKLPRKKVGMPGIWVLVIAYYWGLCMYLFDRM